MMETAENKFPTMRTMMRLILSLLPTFIKEKGRRRPVKRTLKRLRLRPHTHRLLLLLGQCHLRCLCAHRFLLAALSARRRSR
jgi:hypothetical protein